ncbi:MAG: ATP-binding protein [Myxococcota bacterium]|nr:ATP-binding protein [Myxococcota bacterium]
MSSEPSNTPTPERYDSELSYLQDEIRWVEIRCRRIATDLKLARGRDEFSRKPQWGFDQEEPPSVLEDRSESLKQREDELRAHIDACRALHEQDGEPLALDKLCALYELDAFERNVLLLASAPVFSRKFDEIYGTINMDGYGAACLNVEVTYNFNEFPFAERIRRRKSYSRKGKLLANDLISMDIGMRYSAPEDLLMATLHVTARTFGYMIGDDQLMDEFLEFSSVEIPMANFEKVVLNPSDKRRILSVVERHERYLECRKEWGFDDIIRYGRGILMLFYGKPGTGKTMTAHAIAQHMGKRVLNVDIPTFLEHHDAERFLPGLFREARLQNAILFFDECEVLFGDRRAGNVLMTMLLTEIERFEGVAILATNLPEDLDPALERRILVKIQFPEPDRQARHEIWRKHLPKTAPIEDAVDLEILADRFEMTGGYIKNAVLAAVAAAVHDEGEAPVISQAHLEQAARDQLRKPTNEDAVMTVPEVRLKDVILPEEIQELVHELILAARSRRTVLERWGIGTHLTYGKGVSALFHGVPGTGKTLCAEAIAGELNRPLLLATIPGLVSKWVGQTEKNLENLFRDAKAASAVLFLDEADSLLMERGGAQGTRHDDSMVNTLLTLIERFDGIVLLATNMPERLDGALGRRLTYRIGFPFPAPELRAKIWRRLLPETVPIEGELDLEELAKNFPLAGGYIKNAVFKAAFRAASANRGLSQQDLERAASEELATLESNRQPIGFGGD